MIKLLTGNSMSHITGLTTVQFKDLRLLLSYSVSDSAAFFGGATRLADRRYLLGARGGFASGLLYIVNKWIKENNLPVERLESRVVPTSHPGMFHLNLGD